MNNSGAVRAMHGLGTRTPSRPTLPAAAPAVKPAPAEAPAKDSTPTADRINSLLDQVGPATTCSNGELSVRGIGCFSIRKLASLICTMIRHIPAVC